ncbi:MAG: GDP-mannose 4,6-dehydratase [Gemmatimonas sp.]|uniref:GDP-mannose 4,6-dehydratase n=1 Tax=Gemmatimonas sp. TaxID=1962908 RepID=UPI00391F38B1|nr:GDP-mannose 4,6-dehydratase [Gemmatimonadota bacterium]
MKRVLVTGAAGFVGQWLLPALVREGAEVTALALEPPPTTHPRGVPAPEPSVRWLIGDLRDDAHVRAAVEAARADTIVHLAAVSHVPTAAANPALAWDVNVTATARLLHAVERQRDAGGLDPLVLIVGSAEQYGRHDSHEGRLQETAVQAPRTVYAATKAAQEVLALQGWRATGLRTVVARSFNHSGPGQPPRFLLPALIQRALELAGAPAGTPMPVGNRAPIRDFLHVTDVVAAYIALCQRGTPGEAYNVASGTGWSVQDLLDRVIARTGSRAVPTEDPALVRPVDVPVLVGDPRKLQRAVGWRARLSLDDIIDDLLHAATF